MGKTMSENFSALLEVIDDQERMISAQGKLIARLINETVEKENYINAMMREHIE